ncbi:hypothetical protein Pyrfu_1078 [Pyrolobus fumarii 1A]|uniref:Thioredoxin-like fold domain-containing protein n=1 Tax=Pyrolobus fumarii (strain DSM 11204 / 1A) TaxID=694429 RepID=G0EF49_PYRF1|nr:thioredoxin domain-containing protein [Pyrolobus fumarii]AEM38946.1 hypothetical protein Pyrfu_1078 [Pyrolobus fumarii 1A]
MAGRNKAVWWALAGFMIFIFVAPMLSWMIAGVTPRGSGGTDLYIIYDDKTLNAAEALAKFFRQYNLTVELMPASKLNVEFRAYPVVLLAPTANTNRLQSLGILSLVVRGPEGAPMLPYDLVLQIITKLDAQGQIKGLPMHILANATIYFIEGESPAGKLNRMIFANMFTGMLPLFRALFAANISIATRILNITEAKAMGIPVENLTILPAIVAESRYNLTQGTLTVVHLSGDFYTLAPWAMRQLANILATSGVTEGVEVLETPPNTTGLITYGRPEAPVKAVVYWDFLCPFSARFANETLPSLVAAAKQGRLELFFADLIVHPNAFKLHQMGHCVYEKYGQETFVKYAREAFKAVKYATNATLLSSFREELAKKYNVSNCDASINPDDAQRLGITGTPTVVLWSDGYKRLIILVGVKPVSIYERTVNWLAQKALGK